MFYEFLIDFGFLVVVIVVGLSLLLVFNDLNVLMFNYKFKYLLRVVLDMCEYLCCFGKVFVVVKERRDVEVLLEFK